MTKIVQITDLHIGQEGQATMGVDVRQNFLDLLQTTRALAPDLVVISGDICYDTGDEPVYQWVRAQIDRLEIPCTAIDGNHDDPTLLAKAFSLDHLMTGSELFYRREIGGRPVLFLGTGAGFVSQTQLDWIKAELAKTSTDAVIFMHHPPVVGGAPYMDFNHALRNMPELQAILFNFPRQLTIFCGHYHVDKTVCLRNLTVHITPSAYFQVDWRTQAFKVDHYNIGLREIILRDDGAVESTVIYQDGNKTVGG